MGQELTFNLYPLGVGCKGNEQCRLSVMPDNGDAVLIQLLHKPGTSHMARRQNHPVPNLHKIGVTSSEYISQNIVEISPDFSLV